MACFHPLTGARDLKGVVRMGKNAPGIKLITVSCGQCVGCQAERKRQWAVRGMHELQLTMDSDPLRPTPIASFLTLTYSDEHLPPDGNVSLEHWQKFAKRLRANIGSFRFLMCAEYGEEELYGGTERAHLHAIIFGIDFREDREKYLKTPDGNDLFISPALDKTWGKGMHTIGKVTADSIAYVAGYINKKVNGEFAKDHYTRYRSTDGTAYEQIPEFGTMSRGKPGGLGIGWIEKYHKEVYPLDRVIMGGVPGPPPAFYDRWYADHYPSEMEAVRAARQTTAKKHAANNTPERLATREAIFKRKYAAYKQRKKLQRWNT